MLTSNHTVVHFNPATKQYYVAGLKDEIDNVFRWIDTPSKQAIRIAALQQCNYKEVDRWTFKKNL